MTAFAISAFVLVIAFGLIELYFVKRNEKTALDWLDLVDFAQNDYLLEARAIDIYLALRVWRYKGFIVAPRRVIWIVEREQSRGNEAAFSKHISRLYRAAKKMVGER